MKIENYKCEICKTVFTKDEAIKNKKVKAIYFTSNNQFFDIRELPADCDTHICFMCITQLKEKL